MILGFQLRPLTDEGSQCEKWLTILNSSESGMYLNFGTRPTGASRAWPEHHSFGKGERSNGPAILPACTSSRRRPRISSTFDSSDTMLSAETLLDRSPVNPESKPASVAASLAMSAMALIG